MTGYAPARAAAIAAEFDRASRAADAARDRRIAEADAQISRGRAQAQALPNDARAMRRLQRWLRKNGGKADGMPRHIREKAMALHAAATERQRGRK